MQHLTVSRHVKNSQWVQREPIQAADEEMDFVFSRPVHWVAAVRVLKHCLWSYSLTPNRQKYVWVLISNLQIKVFWCWTAGFTTRHQFDSSTTSLLPQLTLCLPGANDQGALVININTWPVKAWPSPPTCIHTCGSRRITHTCTHTLHPISMLHLHKPCAERHTRAEAEGKIKSFKGSE